MLSVLLTEGYHRRGVSLERIAEICVLQHGAHLQPVPRKGTIEVGRDADFALVDLDKEMVVSADYLQSRADFSPWEDQTLKGWAVRTLVRGQTVMRDGEIVGERGLRHVSRPPGANRRAGPLEPPDRRLRHERRRPAPR